MSGCTIGTTFPPELPRHLQLWWQVADGSIAVRATRYMSKFGKLPCLNRCSFAQTSLESSSEWGVHQITILVALTFMSEKSIYFKNGKLHKVTFTVLI